MAEFSNYGAGIDFSSPGGNRGAPAGGTYEDRGENSSAILDALNRQIEEQAQQQTRQQALAGARSNPLVSASRTINARDLYNRLAAANPAPTIGDKIGGGINALGEWLAGPSHISVPTKFAAGSNPYTKADFDPQGNMRQNSVPNAIVQAVPFGPMVNAAIGAYGAYKNPQPNLGDINSTATVPGGVGSPNGTFTPDGTNPTAAADIAGAYQHNTFPGQERAANTPSYTDDFLSRYDDRGENYVAPQYGQYQGQYYNTAGGGADAVPFADVLAGEQESALLNVMQHILQQGLDPNQYGSQFETELQGINVPEGTTDFSQYFPQNIGQQLENTITERTRNEFGQQFENFAPTGFEFDKFSSTSDDAIIDDILSKRYGEALSPLNNAQARGNLSDQGYNFGVGQLNDQRAGATTTLGETGTSVLDRYRGNLTDIATEGRQAAGNYTLGQDFNPQTYSDRIDTTVGELGGNLRGDITNAIGPNPLFDTSTALQKAGVAQGAVNETRPLYDVLARRSEARSGSRGLGTQGVF
jgi:hypothetical protein